MDARAPLYKPLELPGFRIPGNILLAPLAGYTDAAFRAICLEAGASLAFTEMVSCEALSRLRAGTLELLRRAPGERHLAVQLFGADPESAARAAERLDAFGPALVDLNCGCSVPKVLRSGSGAALLRRPELIERLVRAIGSACRAPVSAKLRSGWDDAHVNFLDAAAAAVQGGASMITLHPRTRAQGFGGKADWSQIAALKRALAVPVLGSGDLLRASDAREMILLTGCDGVMFARGALGNPFVFAEARAALEGREIPPPPDVEERLRTAMRHLELAVAEQGERLACREMRKHMQAYTRGMPGAASLRRSLTSAQTRAEYLDAVNDYLARRPPEAVRGGAT